MASQKQTEAARRTIKKAASAAKRRNLPGRSKMGRDELARALGED